MESTDDQTQSAGAAPGSGSGETLLNPLRASAELTDTSSLAADEYNVRCGFGRWRPQWMQCFNTPGFLVFFMALYSLVLGFVVNGIQNVNVSSVERRFELHSTSMGFISGSYDVSAAFLAVIIGYYGSGRKKARLLALAILTSAVGSFTIAIPHFTTGQYSLGTATEKTCVIDASHNGTCSAEEGSSSLSSYLYVFLFAQLLHGIGGTTLFTVGVSLMDDSVPPSKTPLFLGIIYGCNILGSGLGYVVGGKFLNIYVDFDTIDQIDLTPSDTRWLGAWWLGPTIAACLQLVTSIPVSMFGSELPSTKEVRKNRVNQAHVMASPVPTKMKEMKILAITFVLLRNPCFIFITLAMTTEGMFLSSTAAFLPKFLENEYGVSASVAAVTSGMAVIPAAAGGLIMGGYLAKRFNMTIKQIIKFLIVLCILAAMGCSVLWIRCDPVNIYGVSSPYNGDLKQEHATIKLTDACNSRCSCDTDIFEPVCNDKTQLYFSPCYAGCTRRDGQEFLDCACVDALKANFPTNQTEDPLSQTLVSSGCRKPCSLIYLFGVLLFFAMCVQFMPIAPGDSVQLRCVQEEHKVFAQGIKTLLVRMLGSFVGPILMGKILDLQCDIWREKCGHRLSCWIYSHDSLAISIYLYLLALKFLSMTFCIFALKFYQPPKTEIIIMQSNQGHTEDTAVEDEDREGYPGQQSGFRNFSKQGITSPMGQISDELKPMAPHAAHSTTSV